MILSNWLRNLLGTHSELPPKEFNPPIFITGCMRSGTTMLVNKISQHPQLLKVGGELNNIWTEIGGGKVYPKNEYRTASDADFQYSNNMTFYYTRSILDAKSLKRHVMRAVYKWKTGGGRISYDWENVKVLNKSPHLINKIPYVHKMYPGSKVVLIIRPIHEQIASMKMHYLKTGQTRALPKNEKESWRNPSNDSSDDLAIYPGEFKVLPLMWLRLNAIALREIDQMPKEDCFIVPYHELVNNQGECLQKLFDFLDLNDKHKSEERKIIQESIKIFNTSTTGNPSEKWKKHLTEDEKRELEEIIETNKVDYDFIQSKMDNSYFG